MPEPPTDLVDVSASKAPPSDLVDPDQLHGSFLQQRQQSDQRTQQLFEQKTGKKMMDDPVGYAGFALRDPEARHLGFETIPSFGPGEGLMRSRPSLFKGAQPPSPQQTLREAGVLMTPGQMAGKSFGGVIKWSEEMAQSAPILGSFIRNAKAQSIDTFNRAVLDQALAPITRKLPKDVQVGHDAFNYIDKQFDDAYARVKGVINFKMDKQFVDDLKDVWQGMQELPDKERGQFEAILRNRVFHEGRMGQADARVSGEQFKQIESDLGRIASEYRGAADPNQRIFAARIDEVKLALREALERNNPEAAEQLKAINSGYAMLVRAQNAATRRATSGAIFTPSDLLQSIKSQDPTTRKGAFLKGDGLLQPFAEAAQQVLPNTRPDSGTAERGMFLAGAAGLAHFSPESLAASAALSVPYTGPGMRALNALAGRGGAQEIPPTVEEVLRGGP